MTQVQKKTKERAQLQRFCECWPDFPTGELIEQEEPDFVVRSGNVAIGIELRDYLYDEVTGKGSPSKCQESLRARTVASAARHYQAKGLPPVNVSVLWQDNLPLDSRRAKGLIPSLLELVERMLPEPNEQTFLGYPSATWRSLPDEVVTLWIDRRGKPAENFWASQGGGALPEVGIEDIKRAIRAKEKNLPAYRRSADEVWLLVVASGFTTSGFCGIAPELEGHCFETSFDRLFFLQYTERQALELINGSI